VLKSFQDFLSYILNILPDPVKNDNSVLIEKPMIVRITAMTFKEYRSRDGDAP